MEQSQLQVVIPEEFLLNVSQKATEQLINLINEQVTFRNRYKNQETLKKELRIGQDTLDSLITEYGLKYIRLNSKTKLFDMRDVEDALERMKI